MDEEFESMEIPEEEEEDDPQRELSNDEFCQMIKDQVLHSQLSNFYLGDPYPTPTHVFNDLPKRRRSQIASRTDSTIEGTRTSQHRSDQRTPSPRNNNNTTTATATATATRQRAINPLETPPRAQSILATPPSAPHSARSAPNAAPDSPTPHRHSRSVRQTFTPFNIVSRRDHRPANLLARLTAAAATTPTTSSTSNHLTRMDRRSIVQVPTRSSNHNHTPLSRTTSQYIPLDASHLYDLSQFYHTTSHQYNDFQREGAWAETLQYARLSQASFCNEEWCIKINTPLNRTFDSDMAELDKVVESLDDDNWMFSSLDI
ncbi:hypothetical protein BDF22DRAFT_449064 [Syncephalis plumigaleata]|nr:hypothetical protein BDF22DRAFT_449064 [Syncephalis plumigaleata]